VADNARIEDLRRRVQKDPATIAFAQLAEEYRRAGQHQEAVDACSAGLALHPGYLSARVTLGRALIELGELDRAQPELETVLKNAPENLAAIRGMADIHYKRGALPEALECYRTALRLAPNDPELEQMANDLAQRMAPGRRPGGADDLSFDQMESEMAARLPLPSRGSVASAGLAPARVPRISSSNAAGGTPTVSPAQSVQAEDPPVASTAVRASDPEKAHADRAIEALDHWLDAIHVTRVHTTS